MPFNAERKIQECLSEHTKDIHEIQDLVGSNESFYAVQLLSDYTPINLYFPHFETARDYFTIIDRAYKVFFEYLSDGSRKVLNRSDMIRHRFDYFAPIKDIHSIPCGRLVVFDNEAFAHFADAVYCYRFNKAKNRWILTDINNKF